MSTSYYSGVILGLTLPEICDVKLNSDKFEIHDRRGNPTGKFEYEQKWVFNYKGSSIILTRLYTDAIEELLFLDKPFELLDLNNYDDCHADKIVIGVKITSLNYSEYLALKQIDEDYLNLTKKIFVDKFNIEPKLFFYFQISC